ncbi:hypothetical protein CRM22_002761 [Opisthorchis felineus]|uniref:Cdc23 domain-containing protein n=1 Tax=Opisthorchis felineus TaxID=147828 RepID=A0A4S2M904_OPIFE|nr:hypothetical protein CRM22_002761 [Opisthorchis felineus]
MKTSSIDASEDNFPIHLERVRSDLLRTYFACQIRGLTQSCKWLGDLLHALDDQTTEPNKVDLQLSTAIALPQSPLTDLPSRYLSTFLFARSLLDAREYDHCAQTLSRYVSPVLRKLRGENVTEECPPLVYFMYVYSTYMACEKRRANDEVELRRVFEQDGNAKPSQVARARCANELSALRSEIENRVNPSKLDGTQSDALQENDPFILYAFGLVYRRLDMESAAVALFVRAILANPCLWPAWFELAQLVRDKEHLGSLKLPAASSEVWMRYFFEAKIFLKFNETERALDILQRLSNSGFSTSGNLQAEIGLAYDGLRDMDMASRQFEQLFSQFPCRLDNVDAYSNVLFVREDSIELAHLAHHCVSLDKYRPETCCVVGNFFSLRGQHDKAVLYFQRALKLKPSYSLVWTLIGHEYTELRNTKAAVHAYRQAIAHNRHEFRAWYGLGQMYEILDLPSFALHYYREAQYLVPSDSRLIVALGEIYERLNRLDEAKKCYWRAYCVGDIEGSALVRLAQCFIQSDEVAEAAAAYTEYIKLCKRHGVPSQTELAQAYKYLAMYHLQMGHYEDSASAASKCLEFPETREEAKAMFRQITVLAGDVEGVLTDRTSDDPTSTDDAIEDHDPASGSTQAGDSEAVADTPCPRECTGASHPMEPEVTDMDPDNREQQLKAATQSQPLDLSLGFLLSALGAVEKPSASQLDSSAIPTPAIRPMDRYTLWDDSEQPPGTSSHRSMSTAGPACSSLVGTPLPGSRSSASALDDVTAQERQEESMTHDS